MDRKEFSDRPKAHKHHVYQGLSSSERFTISVVYWRQWRALVSRSGLASNEREYFRFYFKEIHARYYREVVLGSSYKRTSVLLMNFLFSRANENLRLMLSSLNPVNAVGLIFAIRSQIELNALVNKFGVDEDYFKEHMFFNENRLQFKEALKRGEKTVVNVTTLVEKMGSELFPYSDEYNECSTLLHPNPSAVKFYAQAEPVEELSHLGIFRPNLSKFFDRTIVDTPVVVYWVRRKVWALFALMEHFFILSDKLKLHFSVNEKEQDQFRFINMLELLRDQGASDDLVSIIKGENR